MAIETVGVVGCGLMGSGIAQTAAQAGYQVAVREVTADLVEKGLQAVDKSLARLLQRGTLTAPQRDAVRSRLRGTTRLEDLRSCDIIIKAITEKPPPRKDLFTALDALC